MVFSFYVAGTRERTAGRRLSNWLGWNRRRALLADNVTGSVALPQGARDVWQNCTLVTAEVSRVDTVVALYMSPSENRETFERYAGQTVFVKDLRGSQEF